MFNLKEPIGNEVIIGSIIFILILVAVGILLVEWFKRKNNCNYSAPSLTNKGNFPRNRSSNALEEETSCLRQVDK